MNFRLLTPEEHNKIPSNLSSNLVVQDNKFWYVKLTPDIQRPYLGYLLGRNFCNIAETKLLTDEETAEIKILLNLPIDAVKNNLILVRIGRTHQLKELPCQTLEKAVANELVYSIWIRRRDTHALNREYLPEGVPVFYDFHIAFLWELKWIHSTLFFRDNPDYGHPPSWRLKEIKEQMTTERARDVITQSSLAWHYVNNINKFIEELSKAEENITKIASTDIHNVIAMAGFDTNSAEMIEDFLKRNLITLNSDIEEMKRIILQ